MDSPYYYNDIVAEKISRIFKRSLFDNINWDQKMIAIKGARGVGKTTLMLRRQKFGLNKNAHPLYVSTRYGLYRWLHAIDCSQIKKIARDLS